MPKERLFRRSRREQSHRRTQLELIRAPHTILDRSYEVAGLEERLTLERSMGALRHTVDTGARLVFEGAHDQQRAGETPSSFSGALGFEERHRTIAISGFLNERLAVRRDRVVTLGVRVEHARFTRSILRRSSRSATPSASSDWFEGSSAPSP